MTISVRSKEEASALGLTNYYTGVPCKGGHVAERNVKSNCCKECSNEARARYVKTDKAQQTISKRKQVLSASGEWQKQSRNRQIKHNYGLTEKDFDFMVHEQSNKCAICGTAFVHDARISRPFVDHDHTSGEVRGLLCHHCNSAIGHFKDNVATLQSAISYLQKGGFK